MIRDRLAAGVIGKVRRVTSTFTFRLPCDPGNIRLQPQAAGGSLLDVGCYPVYGIRWAMSAEPVRAWATARYEYGVDVEMTGVLWFADGAVASFDCGFIHPHRQWLEIVGETGTIYVPEMWVPTGRPEFEVYRDGAAIQRTGAPGEQIQHMLENFSHYVMNGAPVYPSPEDAVKTLRVLDALAQSAREQRIIDVQGHAWRAVDGPAANTCR